MSSTVDSTAAHRTKVRWLMIYLALAVAAVSYLAHASAYEPRKP